MFFNESLEWSKERENDGEKLREKEREIEKAREGERRKGEKKSFQRDRAPATTGSFCSRRRF